jgi:hypothetical protein
MVQEELCNNNRLFSDGVFKPSIGSDYTKPTKTQFISSPTNLAEKKKLSLKLI